MVGVGVWMLLAAVPVPVMASDPAVDRWKGQLERTSKRLDAGKYEAAERQAAELAREMAAKLLPGEAAEKLLALATAYQAVAEAGLGREEDALWHWVIAQNLNPAFRTAPLDRFGEPGVLLARHRLRKAGEPPAGLGGSGEVQVVEEAGAGLTPPIPVGEPPVPLPPDELAPFWIGDPTRVEAVIDGEGRLRAPVVLQGVLPGKVYLGLETLRTWRFEPARMGGEAVPVFCWLSDFIFDADSLRRAQKEAPFHISGSGPLTEARALARRGLELQREGKLREAVAAYRESAVQVPEATTLFNLGSALDALGKREEAVAAYRQAADLDPGNALIHFNLGTGLYHGGELEGAAEALAEAVRLDPGLARAHYNLGIALYELGRLEEAVGSYREAVRLEPELAAAHHGEALALYSQGELSAAVEALRKAVTGDAGSVAANNNLGIALRALGRYQEALECHRRALRLDPSYARAYHDLGLTHLALDQPNQAADAFRRALREEPRSVGTLNHLGIALIRGGELDVAIEALLEAIEIDPRYAPAYQNLGIALQQQGRIEDARKAFERAAELLPAAGSDPE